MLGIGHSQDRSWEPSLMEPFPWAGRVGVRSGGGAEGQLSPHLHTPGPAPPGAVRSCPKTSVPNPRKCVRFNLAASFLEIYP